MAVIATLVAGSTGRDLAVTLTRASNGAAINPTTATLLGKSKDLPALSVSQPLSVAGNVCTLAQFGNLVTPAVIGDRSLVNFTFRVKYVIGAMVDYTSTFDVAWEPELP